MIGIVGYGSYIPLYRIKTEEIARVWKRNPDDVIQNSMMEEKSLPAIDEDTATMAVESSINALKRAKINPKDIGAIYCGSETHAYAVKPDISLIGEAIGAAPNFTGADLEFACKAGTAAMQACMGFVKADYAKYGLAVGSDTARYNLENVTDHNMGAGAASFIIGKKENEILAEIEGTFSYTTDTPDFWRREGEKYPKHTERFTGKPAYFKHTIAATQNLMENLGLKPSDIDHAIFHTPNGKFVIKAAKFLGFKKEVIKSGFIVNKVGNVFSAATLLGLSATLDKAKPGERILMTSFGSGAGSDSFSIKVTDKIKDKVNLAKTTQEYLNNKKYVDYATYCKFTGRLK
ncbi:hydroxymethylglutaryl-CoA synthase [Candidatus Woesearchaeota archaeon]|nr:hydroxymethylglutaryl-CoA synthase [Candidatus Woesearchaeota archaeon]